MKTKPLRPFPKTAFARPTKDELLKLAEEYGEDADFNRDEYMNPLLREDELVSELDLFRSSKLAQMALEQWANKL